MKTLMGTLLFIILWATSYNIQAQSITNVPTDIGNDRFTTEYFSVIRPGLSLNGFDNGGNEAKGLGLKQVLDKALSGDTYIKDKLNKIFEDARLNISTNNPTDDQIETNSRRIQYTAFEALASYVLEHNSIDSVDSNTNGLNIRSHDVAVADLKSKLLFVSSNGASYMVKNDDDFALVPLLCCGMSDRGSASNYKHYEDTRSQVPPKYL